MYGWSWLGATPPCGLPSENPCLLSLGNDVTRRDVIAGLFGLVEDVFLVHNKEVTAPHQDFWKRIWDPGLADDEPEIVDKLNARHVLG